MSSLGVGRTEQLSTMGSDVESKDGKLPNTSEDDLRELEEAYAALRDESQQLINMNGPRLRLKYEHCESELSDWMKT